MQVNYTTFGTCAMQIEVELDDEQRIDSVKFLGGGCNGNLQAIARLVEGMKADEAIEKLRGITCGRKTTSCPDQLSIALQSAIGNE